MIPRNRIPPIAAVENGRPDCPADWLVFEGLGFSVCYPPGHYAETWSSRNFPPSLSVHLGPGEPVAYTPYGMNLRPIEKYEPVTECFYQAEAIDYRAKTKTEPYSIGGEAALACTADAGYAIQFKGTARGPGGALEFWVNARNGEQLDLAKQVLSTVRFVPDLSK